MTSPITMDHPNEGSFAFPIEPPTSPKLREPSMRDRDRPPILSSQGHGKAQPRWHRIDSASRLAVGAGETAKRLLIPALGWLGIAGTSGLRNMRWNADGRSG